jgi:hypothetical protein
VWSGLFLFDSQEREATMAQHSQLRGMRSGGGDDVPLTVQDIRDAIHGLDDDVEVIFGWTRDGKELKFYRFKWRGEKLLQIELNEAD